MNIKIKDIDFELHSARLKINTKHQSECNSLSKSKESQGRDEDEESYEEMKMGSKLDQRKKNQQHIQQNDLAAVQTDGKLSNIEKSYSQSSNRPIKNPMDLINHNDVILQELINKGVDIKDLNAFSVTPFDMISRRQKKNHSP